VLDSPRIQPSTFRLLLPVLKWLKTNYIKKLVVAVKDNKLVATSDASPNEFVELKPSSTKDLFTTKIQSYDAEFLFSRTEGGVKTVKISIAGGQVVLTGDKEVSEYASSFKMAENQYCKKIFIIRKRGKIVCTIRCQPRRIMGVEIQIYRRLQRYHPKLSC